MNQEQKDAMDLAIVKAVTKGANRFAKIAVNFPTDVNHRTIDRRLQFLRRKGRLTFTTKAGWSIPGEKELT